MGGCVSSRPEFPNSVHPNIFTVYPVTRPMSADTIETSSISGTAVLTNKNNATGQLEVVANELILHRRGHEPVHWPLQYVRRYGYENQLFSFESGRRCESGPGIFTFRCRRAHELFLLVQANVQEARTPPAASGGGGQQPSSHQQHGTVSMDNAMAAMMERGRSGSMPSQFRFPGRGSSAQQVVNLRADEGTTPRLDHHNDTSATRTASDRQEEPTTCADRNLVEKEAPQSADADPSQVFVDVLPNSDKPQPLQQQPAPSHIQRQRLSSALSQVSSITSEQSGSSGTAEKPKQHQHDRRRPISFEFVLTPTLSSSQEGGDSSAFASPPDEPIAPQPADTTAPGAITPTTPPSAAYYVNVDPNIAAVPTPQTSAQYQLYQNKHLASVRRAPGRSQSLGSASSNLSDQTQQHHFSDSTNADDHRSYMNALQNPTNGNAPDSANDAITTNGRLDYVTLDLANIAMSKSNGADGATTTTNGGHHRTWTSAIPSSLYKRYQKRQFSHSTLPSSSLSASSSMTAGAGRSLTSVAEVCNKPQQYAPRKLSNQELTLSHENDNGLIDHPYHHQNELTVPSSTNPSQGGASSNYARIDCARTKALRETAAAAQLQRRSTSCSASSTETAETPLLAPIIATGAAASGRRKHNGPTLSFGRRKHHSGDLDNQ